MRQAWQIVQTDGLVIRYLLDTNTVSCFVKGVNERLVQRMQMGLEQEDIAISVVTRAELRYGLVRRRNPHRQPPPERQTLLRHGAEQVALGDPRANAAEVVYHRIVQDRLFESDFDRLVQQAGLGASSVDDGV